jgi:CheY-like chemotaxis protein
MNAPSPAKVLIADDEIFMLRLLEATLRKGGYEVIQCHDGQEALAAAASTRPQLIVMDVMMPGLDGLAAVRRLKQDEATRAIPVIVLSSRGHALTQLEAEQAGAALFLTKPFSPTQLLQTARSLIGPPP